MVTFQTSNQTSYPKLVRTDKGLLVNKHIYLQLSRSVGRKITQNLGVDPRLSFQERSLKRFMLLSIMQNDSSTEVVLEGGPKNHLAQNSSYYSTASITIYFC